MDASGSVFNRRFLLILLLFVLRNFVSLTYAYGSEVVVTVDVHKAKGLIQNGHVYLDVRTEEEFNKGHADVNNIINIPYMLNTTKGMVKNPEFLTKVSYACNKEDHLIVGCLSGVRSLHATTDLMAHGFKNVKNMGGGYLDWVKNEFPVKALRVNEDL